MSKWNELKSWAEAVIGLNKTNLWDWAASVEDGRLGKTHTLFALAANPAAILELITENERLQAEVQETKHEVEILEREVSEYEGHSLLIDAVCYRLGRDVGEGMFGPSRLQRTFLLCHGNAVRLLNLLTKRGRLEQVEDGGCMRRIAGKGGQANV